MAEAAKAARSRDPSGEKLDLLCFKFSLKRSFSGVRPRAGRLRRAEHNFDRPLQRFCNGLPEIRGNFRTSARP
jgi:hypothetical protein